MMKLGEIDKLDRTSLIKPAESVLIQRCRRFHTSNTAAIPCSNGVSGIQSGDVCCSAECIKCGGSGCGRRPGGGEECCVGAISSSGIMCSDSGVAPCIVD